jgi:hypothetical protein
MSVDAERKEFVQYKGMFCHYEELEPQHNTALVDRLVGFSRSFADCYMDRRVAVFEFIQAMAEISYYLQGRSLYRIAEKDSIEMEILLQDFRIRVAKPASDIVEICPQEGVLIPDTGLQMPGIFTVVLTPECRHRLSTMGRDFKEETKAAIEGPVVNLPDGLMALFYFTNPETGELDHVGINFSLHAGMTIDQAILAVFPGSEPDRIKSAVLSFALRAIEHFNAR